jgi:hypothetical protein
VELETVGPETVRCLTTEIPRQIDNLDRVEGTALHANTATNTQGLRDKGDLRILPYLDTKLASSDNWARLAALLHTLLRFALVLADNGDTKSLLVHVFLLLLDHRTSMISELNDYFSSRVF